MTDTMLVAFWVMWLLDVLMALLGYREFIGGVFGRYASPSAKYLALWVPLLIVMLLILAGSVYCKNHDLPWLALKIAAIPLALALPYGLFMAVVLVSSKNNWR